MGCKKMEQRLASVFQWYGELVGRRPLPFLLVPLIMTMIFGPGLLVMKYDDDVMMLFTPFNAPSRREQQIARQFAHTAIIDRNATADETSKFVLPITADHDSDTDTFFLVEVASPDNLMNQHAWTLISKFINDIYTNFTCQVEDWVETDDKLSNTNGSKRSSGPPYTLQYGRDFCDSNRGCEQLNTVVDRVRDLLNVTKYGNNSKVRLTYPVMYIWGRPFNWGQYLFGVNVDAVSGKLLSAKFLMLYLQFQMKGDPRAQNAAKSCILQLSDYTVSHNRDNVDVRKANLTFSPINEPLLAQEVAKIQDYSIPYLVGVIAIIIIFITVSSYKRHFMMWTTFGACMGVLTVGLSLLASLGFLCMCGVQMNFVVAITPFLVLCVGIDNDFLITSAWRQTADGESSVERRMGKAFANCGPSLTITSVNDILCFGIGYMSETPAIADFCLHTSTALFFRFLFQLTFFAAITAYIGKREVLLDNPQDGKKIRFWFLKLKAVFNADPLPIKSVTPEITDFQKFHIAEPIVPKKEHQRIHTFFGQTYARFLMWKSVRCVTAIVFVTYIVSAVYGAASWIIDITPQRNFFDDSILQEAFGLADRYSLPEAIIGRVYVTAPPDFRYRANVTRFLQFVQDLEGLDDGPLSENYAASKTDRTDIWFRPYLDYLQNMLPSDTDLASTNSYQPDFYDYLPDFLSSSDYRRFLNEMRFKVVNGSTPKLDKFLFVVSYFRLVKNKFNYEDNIAMLLRFRAVCENYSEYQAVVFDHFQLSAYYDQRLTLAPACLQTMGIALLSMSVVTALLMPHIRSMFFICLSFLSVDVGVIAGLNAWRSPLDPTSMAFVLMVIGFSVYYTARVCYCYQSAGDSLNSEEKMRRTMETVGWPILQGALATVIGILPTTLIKCYMMRVFYRTVVLVVFVGLLHGLLIMPVFMCAFDRPSTPVALRRATLARRLIVRRKNIDGDSPDTSSEYSNQ